MAVFRQLRRLTLVEFMMEADGIMPEWTWAQVLLSKLEKHHPSLRWVVIPRIHETKYSIYWSTVVWEKAGVWKERIVPFTSHLSMVNGDYQLQL